MAEIAVAVVDSDSKWNVNGFFGCHCYWHETIQLLAFSQPTYKFYGHFRLILHISAERWLALGQTSPLNKISHFYTSIYSPVQVFLANRNPTRPRTNLTHDDNDTGTTAKQIPALELPICQRTCEWRKWQDSWQVKGHTHAHPITLCIPIIPQPSSPLLQT